MGPRPFTGSRFDRRVDRGPAWRLQRVLDALSLTVIIHEARVTSIQLHLIHSSISLNTHAHGRRVANDSFCNAPLQTATLSAVAGQERDQRFALGYETGGQRLDQRVVTRACDELVVLRRDEAPVVLSTRCPKAHGCPGGRWPWVPCARWLRAGDPAQDCPVARVCQRDEAGPCPVAQPSARAHRRCQADQVFCRALHAPFAPLAMRNTPRARPAAAIVAA
jgi:hypothetical protein